MSIFDKYLSMLNPLDCTYLLFYTIFDQYLDVDYMKNGKSNNTVVKLPKSFFVDCSLIEKRYISRHEELIINKYLLIDNGPDFRNLVNVL